MKLKKSIIGFRKLLVGIFGTLVLLFGIILIVIPGPAIIVIPLGLGILAIEFDWAKNLLAKIKKKRMINHIIKSKLPNRHL
jgi:uncharacterized protein (TIGR02611 family)